MRVALVATALVLAAGAVGADAVPARAQQRPAQNSPAGPARFALVDETQWVQADGTFLLGVDVSSAPAGSRVESSLYSEVPDRSAFLKSLFADDLGPAKATPPPVMLDDVAGEGGVRRVFIIIRLRQSGPSSPGQISLVRGLGGPGVYPLLVRLVSDDGRDLASFVTYLIRLPTPDTDLTPLTVSVLLPLHAPPSIAPDGEARLSPRALADIAARVRAMAEVPDLPLTLAPTPETIDAMARAGGVPSELLLELRRATGRLQVLDGPYVDVALTSWTEAGMDDELNRERVQGNAILTEQVGPVDGTTWLGTRELSTDAATKLWTLGVRRLLLPAGSVAAEADADEPATAIQPFEVSTPLASPLEAVTIDDSLPGRFSFAADAQLAAHHLLAELAVIHDEAPDASRGVVLTPPPGWQASRTQLVTLFRGLTTSPILTPATVAGLFGSVPLLRGAPDGAGPAVTRDLTPLPSPSIDAHAAARRRLRSRITSYQGVVGESSQVDSWLQRLLVSGAADLTPRQRDRYLSVIGAAIADRIATIDAPRRQTVTLTARDGSIPLTLRSGFEQPVTVQLELETSRRLEFPDGDRVTVTLDPGTEQVRVRVRTRSPGASPLDIRVVSPDGGLMIAQARVTVRSTAVSGIGTVLSLGAAAFLVLWWIRHWRRIRRARRLNPEAAAVAAQHDVGPAPAAPA